MNSKIILLLFDDLASDSLFNHKSDIIYMIKKMFFNAAENLEGNDNSQLSRVEINPFLYLFKIQKRVIWCVQVCLTILECDLYLETAGRRCRTHTAKFK